MSTALGLAALWMLGVDRSTYIEHCPDCDHFEDITELRVFSIPVHRESTVDPGMKERVGQDLGAPCGHLHMERQHRHREWGLMLCAAPCINGTVRLIGDDWYDQAVSARARELAVRDPAIVARFRDKVLIEHDQAAWWEIRAGIGPTRQPPD